MGSGGGGELPEETVAVAEPDDELGAALQPNRSVLGLHGACSHMGTWVCLCECCVCVFVMRKGFRLESSRPIHYKKCSNSHTHTRAYLDRGALVLVTAIQSGGHAHIFNFVFPL